MGVLKCLLRILLIIGKIVLILLLVILALIVLILCAPFCYRAQIKKDTETFAARAGVSWLWFVLRAQFTFENNRTDFEVRILGIPLMKLLRKIKGKKGGTSGKQTDRGVEADAGKQTLSAAGGVPGLPEKEGDEDAGHPMPVPEERQGAQTAQSECVSAEMAGQGHKKEHAIGKAQISTGKIQGKSEPESDGKHQGIAQTHVKKRQERAGKQQDKEKKKAAKKQAKDEKARQRSEKKQAKKAAGRGSRHKEGPGLTGKIKTAYSKGRAVWDLLHSDMFRGAYATGKLRLKKILRHVMPRRIQGYLRFGMNDPATTGQLCGLLAMIYPKTPPKLKVYPDFQEACFEADLDIRGHIILIYLLIQAVKILLDKNVRALIKRVRGTKKKRGQGKKAKKTSHRKRTGSKGQTKAKQGKR